MVFFVCVFVDLTKQKNQNYETNTIYSNKQGSKIKTEKFEKINQSLNFDVKLLILFCGYFSHFNQHHFASNIQWFIINRENLWRFDYNSSVSSYTFLTPKNGSICRCFNLGRILNTPKIHKVFVCNFMLLLTVFCIEEFKIVRLGTHFVLKWFLSWTYSSCNYAFSMTHRWQIRMFKHLHTYK